MRPRTRSRRRRLLRRIVVAFSAVLLAFLAYSYAETYRVEVKSYTFSDRDVPPAFNGLKIALLTDIHRSWFFRQGRVERIVDQVNALAPDLILLGGDYVYGGTDYERPCFEALGRLRAPLGVFAALGNHDYGAYDDEGRDLSSVYAAVKQTDIVLLRNEGVWLRKGDARLRLGAVADLQEDVPELALAVGSARNSDLVILVSHNPDFAEQLPPEAVDLMLSGHTHGGQITLFGLWAPVVPSQYGQKYRTGMVTVGDAAFSGSTARDNGVGDTTIVVSNGLGAIFPPLRFFARPQIVVVTLARGP